MHTNGTAVGARIEGVPSRDELLAGPGFELALSASGQDTTVRVSGSAAPEQVVRLLAQQGALDGRRDQVTVHVETTQGGDVYVYTAGLRHRLLFRREWNREGRVGVFYGLNPFLADTDGDVADVPGRASLRNVVRILSADGPLARIDVMNLFTYRSASAAGLPARPEDRVAVPQLERAVLSEADVVLLAWGAKVDHRHRDAVEDLLRVIEDVGATPAMLERDGQLLTSGDPPQPAHPARLGYRGIRAVTVDAQDVLGQRRQPATKRPRSRPSPPDQPRATETKRAPSPRPDRSGGHLVSSSQLDALAWAEAHLDALGREAVRRLLSGEQHSPPHPDVPNPGDLLRRAHEGGEPWDALDLVVAAHRITSGIAWRWIGARYLLDANDLSPDLEDLRRDGKKVTGKPYAEAAREAMTRISGSRGVTGNALAPGNQRRLTFGELARRWDISDDLIGATLGPGAPQWIASDALQVVGKRFGKHTHYRVTREGAAWTRDGG